MENKTYMSKGMTTEIKHCKDCKYLKKNWLHYDFLCTSGCLLRVLEDDKGSCVVPKFSIDLYRKEMGI